MKVKKEVGNNSYIGKGCKDSQFKRDGRECGWGIRERNVRKIAWGVTDKVMIVEKEREGTR